MKTSYFQKEQKTTGCYVEVHLRFATLLECPRSERTRQDNIFTLGFSILLFADKYVTFLRWFIDEFEAVLYKDTRGIIIKLCNTPDQQQ